MFRLLLLIVLSILFVACESKDDKPKVVVNKDTDKRYESLPPELRQWGEDKKIPFDELSKVFDLVYSPTQINWVTPDDKRVWVPKITRITPDMVGTIIGPHWSHNPQGVPYMSFESPKKVPLRVRYIKTKFDPISQPQQMKSAIVRGHQKENDLNDYQEIEDDASK